MQELKPIKDIVAQANGITPQRANITFTFSADLDPDIPNHADHIVEHIKELLGAIRHHRGESLSVVAVEVIDKYPAAPIAG